MTEAGMSPGAEISVVVVNYGTAELAIAGVESVLARDHGERRVDIHLVDNASPGDDRAVLAEKCASPAWQERVTFYPETENHGFGRGHNLVFRALAARATPPDYVFLLNPDARLENEAIALLADFLDATPAAGFAGAGISKPDSGPVTAAFRFPGLVSEWVQTLGFGPVSRLFSGHRVALPPDHPRGPVGWVAGAAVMARLSTVRSHDAARPPRPAYWYQSWAHYYRAAKGPVGAAALALGVIVAAAGHQAQMRLRGKPSALPGRFIPDFWKVAARPLLQGRDPLA